MKITNNMDRSALSQDIRDSISHLRLYNIHSGNKIDAPLRQCNEWTRNFLEAYFLIVVSMLVFYNILKFNTYIAAWSCFGIFCVAAIIIIYKRYKIINSITARHIENIKTDLDKAQNFMDISKVLTYIQREHPSKIPAGNKLRHLRTMIYTIEVYESLRSMSFVDIICEGNTIGLYVEKENGDIWPVRLHAHIKSAQNTEDELILENWDIPTLVKSTGKNSAHA